MPDIRRTEKLVDFVPPDENPFSEGGKFAAAYLMGGGGWNVDERGPLQKCSFFGGYGLAVQNRPATLQGPFDSTYYTQRSFSGDQIEVWGLMGGGGLGAALEDWRVALYTNPGGNSPPDGYQAIFGGGVGEQYYLRKYSGGSFENVVVEGGSGGHGRVLMLRIDGDKVQVWRGESDGVGTWTKIIEITDTTWRDNLYLAWLVEDPTNFGLNMGFRDIGGGIPRMPQIYRILPALGPIELDQ